MAILPLAWFPVGYLVAACALAWMNRREFKRSPEKGVRYRKLPLRYKLACWVGVLPAFLLTIFLHPALSLVGLVGFAALEIACVRWYRRSGLWSAEP